MSKFLQRCEKLAIPKIFQEQLKQFYLTYKKALEETDDSHEEIFLDFISAIEKEIEKPHTFGPYSAQVLTPFDHYQFGQNFVRPLIIKEQSSIQGEENFIKAEQAIARGENVVFFSNHQIEADPQVLALMLEENHPQLAKDTIIVAGERVITDPLAIPFSKGHNLLCIYSRRYIDNPPEEKEGKIHHNRRALEKMRQLLQEGGKAIYVAPSGGRDRRDEKGTVQVAPFDPDSIEIFYLMAKKAKTPTHFYPLTLSTYDLLPPPRTVKSELGEERVASRCPVHVALGDEILMDAIPGLSTTDRHRQRAVRADYIWNIVAKTYLTFPKK